MNKTRIDFQVAAFLKNPHKWTIHHCSICNYPCSYLFSPCAEYLAYDSGCHCTGQDNVHPCSWGRLADYYNMQTNEDYIKKMNEFWGFVNGGNK